MYTNMPARIGRSNPVFYYFPSRYLRYNSGHRRTQSDSYCYNALHGTFLNYLVHGFGYYANGTLITGRSSFLFASVFVSLLVIPIIARATEEGLDSLPKDIREGSLASRSLGRTYVDPYFVAVVFTQYHYRLGAGLRRSGRGADDYLFDGRYRSIRSESLIRDNITGLFYF